MPAVIKEKVRTYAITKFDTDYTAYNEAVKGEKFELAKLRRNEMIFQLKRNIDANYLEFENGLYIGKAISNILFDITELGAALAGTISNGERAKTIISKGPERTGFAIPGITSSRFARRCRSEPAKSSDRPRVYTRRQSGRIIWP